MADIEEQFENPEEIDIEEDKDIGEYGDEPSPQKEEDSPSVPEKEEEEGIMYSDKEKYLRDIQQIENYVKFYLIFLKKKINKHKIRISELEKNKYKENSEKKIKYHQKRLHRLEKLEQDPNHIDQFRTKVLEYLDLNKEIDELNTVLIEKRTENRKQIKKNLKKRKKQLNKIIDEFPLLSKFIIEERTGFVQKKPTQIPLRHKKTKAFVPKLSKEAQEAVKKLQKETGERLQKFMKKHMSKTEREMFYKEIEDLDIDFQDLTITKHVEDISEIPTPSIITHVDIYRSKKEDEPETKKRKKHTAENYKWTVKLAVLVPEYVKKHGKFVKLKDSGDVESFLDIMKVLIKIKNFLRRIDVINNLLDNTSDQDVRESLLKEQENIRSFLEEEFCPSYEKYIERKEGFLSNYRKPIVREEAKIVYFDPEVFEVHHRVATAYTTDMKSIKFVKSLLHRLSPTDIVKMVSKETIGPRRAAKLKERKKLVQSLKVNPMKLLNDKISDHKHLLTVIKSELENLYPIPPSSQSTKEIKPHKLSTRHDFFNSLPVPLYTNDMSFGDIFRYVEKYLCAKYKNIDGATLQDKIINSGIPDNDLGKLESAIKRKGFDEFSRLYENKQMMRYETQQLEKAHLEKIEEQELFGELEENPRVEFIIAYNLFKQYYLAYSHKVEEIIVEEGPKKLSKKSRKDDESIKKMVKEIAGNELLQAHAKMYKVMYNELIQILYKNKDEMYEDLNEFMDNLEKGMWIGSSPVGKIQNVQSFVYNEMQRFRVVKKQNEHITQALNILAQGKLWEIKLPSVVMKSGKDDQIILEGNPNVLQQLVNVCENEIETHASASSAKGRVKRASTKTYSLRCHMLKKQDVIAQLTSIGEQYTDETVEYQKYQMPVLETIKGGKEEVDFVKYVQGLINNYMNGDEYRNYVCYQYLRNYYLSGKPESLVYSNFDRYLKHFRTQKINLARKANGWLLVNDGTIINDNPSNTQKYQFHDGFAGIKGSFVLDSFIQQYEKGGNIIHGTDTIDPITEDAIFYYIFLNPNNLSYQLYPSNVTVIEKPPNYYEFFKKTIDDIGISGTQVEYLVPSIELSDISVPYKDDTIVKNINKDIVDGFMGLISPDMTVFAVLCKMSKLLVCLDPSNSIGENFEMIRFMVSDIKNIPTVFSMTLTDMFNISNVGNEIDMKSHNFEKIMWTVYHHMMDTLQIYVQTIDPTIIIPYRKPVEYPNIELGKRQK